MNDQAQKRFRILVCIDGSDESYRGLSYAVRLGRGIDADIHLLYIRPVDQGLSSGGLEVRVARENVLEWGLELPGVRYLKEGRDMLVEMGHISEDWEESFTHNDLEGDPLGNHQLTYHSLTGKEIRLILHADMDAASGILDRQEAGNYDLVILGASGRRRGAVSKVLGLAPVALKVAVHATCSVLVSRELTPGNGHLICLDGSEAALAAMEKDALLANRCLSPISLISIARDDMELNRAEANVQEGRARLNALGIDVHESIVRVGDPVAEIVEAGAGFTLIALSDTAHSGVRRFFMGGVSLNLLEHAHNSVMIVR